MKTAISVPDATHARVEARVAELRLTRSEFYARAAERYLDELESDRLTKQIDEAVAADSDAARRETREFIEAGRRSSALRNDEW